MRDFYNLDKPLVEIDNTDKQIKEVLQLQRTEDNTHLTSNKIPLPFEFVRREIVENTDINDNNVSGFILITYSASYTQGAPQNSCE